MPKFLVIMESAKKCESVQKYLGKDYVAITCKGHCIDLPPNKIGVDVKKEFKPAYSTISGKEKILAELIKKSKKSKLVYLMTDPDREGEAIAWHLSQALPEGTKFVRVSTDQMTEEGILEAFKNPADINLDLVNSYEARRILDRLVGYKCSYPVKKATGGISVGRVQSAGLKILAEREKAIRSFVPEDYFVVKGVVKGKKEKVFVLVKKPKPLETKTEEQATEIATAFSSGKVVVHKFDEKNVSVKSSAPFRTSTLIQAASTFLGMSTKKTMTVAQKLYERGLITYHRTDSINISQKMLALIVKHIKSEYGTEYAPSKPNFFKKKAKNAQEAHEGIRPTKIGVMGVSGDEDMNRLYALIWAKTISSQMSNAIYARRSVEFKCEDYIAGASGSKCIFDGFRKVWKYSGSEDSYLPKFTVGDVVKAEDFSIEAKETKPPQRYSEASFVQKMEADGVGRPSTYASIINVLKTRDYIDIKSRSIEVKDLGLTVIDFLDKVGFCFSNIEFTSAMEDNLDKIVKKETNKLDVLKDFWSRLVDDLDNCKKIEEESRKTDFDCPKCEAESKLERKYSKFGPFFGCSSYPTCKYMASIGEDGSPVEKEKKEKKELVLSEHDCPKCSEKMVERTGRYGKFFGCSKYPKCRGIRKENGEEHVPKKRGLKKWAKKKKK